ncbi:MAG: acyltransferase family protein [Actinomycetota bacterium]
MRSAQSDERPTTGRFPRGSSALILSQQECGAEDEAAPVINDRGYQPEVQGIRALAVGLVLFYHFWPAKLTGGFIGVDIFFVVSGFLISSHMYREAASTGGVRIGRFWARRVRRLLPISLLVLLVSLLAALALLPKTVWATTFRQVAASALYTQNWILAGDAVDYSAADNAATLVQHYWSLSVEEQFYLVWPVIFVGAVAISRVTRRRLSSRALPIRGYVAILVSLATLFAASLAYSVVATHADSARSYFVTPTRVWEFAAGSLIALTFLGRQWASSRSSLIAWAGLAMIVVSSFRLSSATPFPGWAALFPVMGACILLGAPGGYSPGAPRWWLSRKPLTFLGDISYGIYLWHWPMIVLGRSVLDKEPELATKLILIVLTIGLASASKKYVEDPWRHGQILGSTRRAMIFAAAGTALIALSAFAAMPRIDTSPQTMVERQSKDSCFGPGALVRGAHCASVLHDSKPSPGPEVVVAQNQQPAYPGCQSPEEGTAVLSCGLGVAEQSADRTVAIVGDSHASQWFSALDQLGRTRNWHIKTFTKAGCPVTFAIRSSGKPGCLAFSHDVADRIAKDPSISVVLPTSRAYAYGYASGGDPTLAVPSVDGYAAVWRQWLDAGKRVVVLGEVPNPGSKRVPDCLAKNPAHSRACSRPAADAVPKTLPLAVASEKLKSRGVLYMAMRDFFCDRTTCYAVVGGLITYRDSTHISTEYSLAMAPYIGTFLDRSGIM